jgi:hypothetical protein
MTIRDEITCLTSGCYIHKKWKAAWCRELEVQRLTIILFFFRIRRRVVYHCIKKK